MLDAELAAAVFKAPAAFLANDKGASRTTEGERTETEAAVAKSAAFAA